MIISHRGERHYTQPWGLAGGSPGVSSKSVVVRADGARERVPSKMNIELRRGDWLLLWTSGGGGYGDPRERVPESVLDDVLDGKVSVKAAERQYGVVIRDDVLDVRGTEAVRARVASEAGGS